MHKRLAAFILVGMGLVPAAAASAQAAAPPTTTPAPVPAPAPIQQPTGLGTDAAMDLLASACFNGTMQACDDLYDQSPAGSAYETYGDTCAGRQPAGTGLYCADVFTDTAVVQPTTPTTAPPVNPNDVPHADSLAQIMSICVPRTVEQAMAEMAETSAPQAVQDAATQEGITPQQWITNTLNNRHIGVGTADETILLMDPYEDEGEGDDPPLTPWGLIMGKMFSCADHSSGMPDDVFHDFMLYPEGEATYGPWTMTWFLEPIEEGGEEHAFVRFRSTVAQTPTTAPPTTTTESLSEPSIHTGPLPEIVCDPEEEFCGTP